MELMDEYLKDNSGVGSFGADTDWLVPKQPYSQVHSFGQWFAPVWMIYSIVTDETAQIREHGPIT